MVPGNSENNSNFSREELLEQRRELLASINYASFIQKAIFPEPKTLDKILNEYFVLHLPRDIVSGDFYYCTRVEGYTVLAAGDCTGHGVPGALMSIMGVSFLNDIMSGGGPWKASRILNLLRERVMRALHQTGMFKENKDSIDMALLVFNEDTGELQYAGANNPLYLVRDGNLEEIKADKMPVGINAIEEESFTNHSLRLISNDMIYIFSDGFADQFGGEQDKKYKYGPFKKLITGLADKDLVIQKQMLISEFLTWKGSNDQVDDVLIMGIRFI
ncbi:MAG: SpoIIE family protein phosphatase [Bacteroidales bacterium]